MWAQALSYYFIRVLNSQLRNAEVLLYTGVSILIDIGIKLLLYRNLGPLALGLGVSMNSIVLLLLTIRAFRLGTSLLLSMLWMALGAVFYVITTMILKHCLSSISSLSYFALSTAIFCLFWVVYIPLVPHLRKSINPVFAKLCRYKDKSA